MFWDGIHCEHDRSPGAWLLIGDYNGIWTSSYRSSGTSMDCGFRRMRFALNNLGIILIPTSSFNFSYINRRQG